MSKAKNLLKRTTCLFLTAFMVLSSSNLESFVKASEGDTEVPSFDVAFTTVSIDGKTQTAEASDNLGNFYMISKMNTVVLTTLLRPQYTKGYVENYEMSIVLPYLYYDDAGILVAVNIWVLKQSWVTQVHSVIL